MGDRRLARSHKRRPNIGSRLRTGDLRRNQLQKEQEEQCKMPAKYDKVSET